MYRQVLAHQLRQERPRAETILSSPDTLRDEAERTKPHLIFASEVPPEFKEAGGVFWVELSIDDRLDVNIRADGYSAIIHDVSLGDLLRAVDKVE